MGRFLSVVDIGRGRHGRPSAERVGVADVSDLTVVTIGPLTNVALAIAMDPDFLSRINHLYIGAGHIHSAANPDTEFNARMDAEAYHIVMKHATPDKVTMLPFSQAKQYLTYSKFEKVAMQKEADWSALDPATVAMFLRQDLFEKVAMQKEADWSALDPATVAMFLRQDLVEEREKRNEYKHFRRKRRSEC
ncbi:Salivary purine nucleosidase [Operophtera brumata]|uniref:Salivary purine nucleosidase n=1 Tax=Operophtera brumata TaxID=104452 RepID=A0A0L7L6J7_OPEBR|nr:Salivary purine nucleosidase [Operophtera brumata]